jgi:carbon-monoxide dehydrogenase large subunit
MLTTTMADYLIPSASDLPDFTTDRTETPATSNPLGVKGVGEAGTIASTPAVVNSVLDAIRHLGVKDIDMPTTPYRVWSAIQKASGTAGRGDEANIASPGAGLGSTASDISKGDTQGGHL